MWPLASPEAGKELGMLGRTAGSGFHHPWAAVPPAAVCKPAGTYKDKVALPHAASKGCAAAMSDTPECTQHSLVYQPNCSSPARVLLLLLHQSAPPVPSAAAGMHPAAGTTTQQSRTCASSSSTLQDVSRACSVQFHVCRAINTTKVKLQAPQAAVSHLPTASRAGLSAGLSVPRQAVLTHGMHGSRGGAWWGCCCQLRRSGPPSRRCRALRSWQQQ